MARGWLRQVIRTTVLALLAVSAGAGPAMAAERWQAGCRYALYLPAAWAGAAAPAVDSRAARASSALTDFNGDGCADLVIGIPGEIVEGQAGAGAFQVLYGRAAGLSLEGQQRWHQGVTNVTGAVEPGDELGDALAAGDFDGDGFGDVAAGAPSEAVGDAMAAGAVNVLYGSAAGIATSGNQQWHQDVGNVEGVAQAFDRFGAALAAGDFNGDGYDDLAAGVPGEQVESEDLSGAVNVIYGSGAGLTVAGDQRWFLGAAAGLGSAQFLAHFGDALAAGDFDGDGYDDLAIGAPDEDVSGQVNGGAVYIIYGSLSGLSAAGAQRWHQASPDVFGSVEAHDYFGNALAAANFDGNNYDDLAIGVPGEALGEVAGAGVVHVLFGTSAGLTGAGSDFVAESDAQIDGEAGDDNHLGGSLGAGDFDADGYADLAMGLAGEIVDGQTYAGAVLVMYGSVLGLSWSGEQVWTQATAGVAGTPEHEDFFGHAMSAGDFDGDGDDDLAIGAVGESVGGHTQAGAVHVLYGAPAGLSTGGAQLWHADLDGWDGEAGDNAHLGAALR